MTGQLRLWVDVKPRQEDERTLVGVRVRQCQCRVGGHDVVDDDDIDVKCSWPPMDFAGTSSSLLKDVGKFQPLRG